MLPRRWSGQEIGGRSRRGRSSSGSGQRPSQATARPDLPAGKEGDLGQADFAARAFTHDGGRAPTRFSQVPEGHPQHSQATVSIACPYVGIPCHKATHMLVHRLYSPCLMQSLRSPLVARRSLITQIYPTLRSGRRGDLQGTKRTIRGKSEADGHGSAALPCNKEPPRYNYALEIERPGRGT